MLSIADSVVAEMANRHEHPDGRAGIDGCLPSLKFLGVPAVSHQHLAVAALTAIFAVFDRPACCFAHPQCG